MKIINRLLSMLLFYIALKMLKDVEYRDSKGRMIKPFHPECKGIELEIIELSLAGTNRFFAQTRISVLQHCNNMAKVFIYQNEKELAKQALLHEVGEAFLGDLITPVKRQILVFKMLEDYLMAKIFKCHNLPTEMDQRVKALDKDMVVFEAEANMNSDKYWRSVHTPSISEDVLTASGCNFLPMPEEEVRKEFNRIRKILEI